MLGQQQQRQQTMTAVAAEKQEAGGALRRIMMVVAVSVLMAVMAAPAFAVKGGFANDDKNNPTAPGQFEGPAWDNRNEHCQERWDSGDRPGDGLPAQCYTTPA